MRKGISILSLLLFVSILQAQFNMTAFITPYLYNGENYSRDVKVFNFTLSEANYSLVAVNSTPIFLLNMSENPSFVQNQTQVASILYEYYLTYSYPTQAELNDLNSSFNYFLSSRGSNELECKVITGLATPDGHPFMTCTIDNNCESCRSVPVCNDYMTHTLTSPDPMSSPLAQAILKMSYDFRIIDTNVSKFKDNFANVSLDVAPSLAAMKDSLASIESVIGDLSQPPVSKIYEQYAATHSNDALEFCKDFYSSYNLTALNNAASKAASLSLRVPSQSDIALQVQSVLGNTEERKANRTIREQMEAFDIQYAGWIASKSNLTERANSILSYIRDNKTSQDLAELDGMLVELRQLGDARNYSQAEIVAENFSHLLYTADSYVTGLTTSYDTMMLANSSASDAIFEASLYVDSDDIVTLDTLDGLRTQKASLEFEMYNESPMLLSQVDNITDQLNAIRLDANSIQDEKETASPQEMNNLLAVIAKPLVSFSLGIISSFMPLSYADKEKDAPTIIGVLLVVADIVVFLFVLAVFFFMVRSRRIELHNVARFTWAFIFAFFLIMLVLGSLAIYNIANLQSNPTTFSPFISEFRNSAKVGVVADLTGINGTMRDSMVNCSAKIASKIESLNKSVMYYKFDGESCITENNTLAISACQDALDANPVITLSNGTVYKATFNVFLTKKAVFQGDEQFFDECPIPKVLR